MLKKISLFTMIFILSACSTLQDQLTDQIQQPEVTYKSIALGKVSMEVVELKPTFMVNNKNAFPIPVDALSYELSLNNKKMLNGKVDEIGTLAANADKDVTVPITLTQETLTSLQQLLFKDKKIDYLVKGAVTTMGLSVPFEESGTLHVPTIKVRDFSVNNASFDELSLMLSVDIDNQNEFDLPLEEVSYTVRSGSQELFKGALNKTQIAKGHNNIEIPVNIKPSQIFTNLFSLLLSPELPLHVEISTPLFTKSYDHTLNLSSIFAN